MARTLVVEADEEVRALVALLLDLQGHEVLEVGDGAAALALVEQGQVDLVVSDVLTSGLSGLELTRALRDPESRPGGTSPAIVLLTGRADGPEAAAGSAAGADACVTKPFDVEDFLEVVAEVLADR